MLHDDEHLRLLSIFHYIVGGLAALIAAESQLLSLGAVCGFVTVFSIAARQQILVIRRLRQLQREQGNSSMLELILHGTRERSASILMTALTIGVACVPLVFMGARSGLETFRPAALVILSGMITCTWINLFVVPTLYLRFAKPA